MLTALAILRLPGGGGHVPVDGLKTGGAPTQPIELPGILLAALATLGLGLVLGPEAPLIALGMGLGALAIRLARKDAPDQLVALMAAAGAFAAIASLFGSPVVGAVIIIEATGLGGATLPVILLPGLLAAGIGSLVFIGMGSWTGLSTSAYALSPLALPAFSKPDWNDFLWAIALADRRGRHHLRDRRARAAGETPGRGPTSGAHDRRRARGRRPRDRLQPGDWPSRRRRPLLRPGRLWRTHQGRGPTLSLSTLALLLLFKGLAWSLSLGNFRGGPMFPALFLGAVGGLLAGHLPGLSETPAVAILMAAACVSILKLPLSCTIITLVLTSRAGLGVSPLIVVAVVVGYLTIQSLTALRAALSTTAPAPASSVNASQAS